MRKDIAPLSAGFMLTAIVGLIITIVYFQKFGPSWGTTFLIFFVIMLIASFRSMTYAPSIEELKLDKQLSEYKTKIKTEKKVVRTKHKAKKNAVKKKKKAAKKKAKKKR